MSDAISVECPKCSAKLKLKSRSAVGKKVPCPKCKKPFVVELPPDDDEFMNVAEPDEFEAVAEADDAEDFSRLPPARTGRSTSKKNPKKRRAGSGNWQKPALIGGSVIAVLALLGGVGIVVAPLIGDLLSRNKIDTAWLPPDADVFVHVRVADAWNSPFVKSVATMPVAQPGVANFKQMLGLDPQEIRSLTVGAKTPERTAVLQPAPAAGFGLNPAFGAMPAMPGAGGFGHAVTVVRMLQPFDSKTMQTRLQSTRTAPYQSHELIYPGGAVLAGSVCFFPDTSTVVFGAEADVKAAIDRGGKATRCAELDFIDASPHVVIVAAPKNPMALRTNSAPGGAAVPAGADLSKMMDAHVVGVSLGLNFNDDLDVSAITKCATAAGAKEISAEFEKQLQEGKSQISKLLSGSPPQLANLLTTANTIVNSITIQANGKVVEARGKIPASIKGAIESSLPTLMLAGAMGGLPGANPPGNFPPGNVPPGNVPQNNFPPSTGVGGFGLPTAGGPERTEADAAAPGQINADPFLAAREAQRLSQCKNNLKQLGLAMHIHHDSIGKLPGGSIRDKSGKPLLSWRVALLPYVDQNPLYNEFHLNEPWDSEHNKKLITRMPPLFACPDGKAAPGMTSYLAVIGSGAIFEAGDPRKIADVTDGTSNTILLVEADDSRAVTWTKPDDYAYDSASPMKGLVGHHPGGFLALTCDGAVHFIAETLDPKLLVALFTRSGGESIPPGVFK